MSDINEDFAKNFMIKALSNILLPVIAPVATSIEAIISGFVFLHLWRWFIVPIVSVPTLPRLNLLWAAGILMLISMSTYHIDMYYEVKNPNITWQRMYEKYVWYFCLLLVGYIFHFYI